MEIFGFEITRKKDELRVKETQTAKSFVPPVDVVHGVFALLVEHVADIVNKG